MEVRCNLVRLSLLILNTFNMTAATFLTSASVQGPNTLSNPDAKYRYTTDQPGLQSNLEANDLSELMDMVSATKLSALHLEFLFS